MENINKNEAEHDNFDKIWHRCVIGFFAIAFIGAVAYAYFFS